MRRIVPLGATLVIAILGLLGTPLAQAQTILADIAGDYATTGTLTDNYGTGTWTYYASTAATGGDMTALTFGTLGNAGNSGYGLTGSSFNMPGVSDHRLFGDGAFPSANQLAWHPGDGAAAFTVLRWTAGPGEAGSVRLEGAFSKLGEPNGSVAFYIFVNGAQSFAQTGIGMGSTHAYDFTTNILTGHFVDFVLSNNGNGFGGDESLISGTITSAIPEPSTYAVLAGLAALGLAFLRKRHCTRPDST